MNKERSAFIIFAVMAIAAIIALINAVDRCVEKRVCKIYREQRSRLLHRILEGGDSVTYPEYKQHAFEKLENDYNDRCDYEHHTETRCDVCTKPERACRYCKIREKLGGEL